jgi:hypothetical protein
MLAGVGYSTDGSKLALSRPGFGERSDFSGALGEEIGELAAARALLFGASRETQVRHR